MHTRRPRPARLLLLSLSALGACAGGGSSVSAPISDAATSPEASTQPSDASAATDGTTGSGMDTGAPGAPAADAGALDGSLSGKKGIGLGSSGDAGEPQLQALGVAWYYDWGSAPAHAVAFPFVPMIFSPADVTKAVTGPVVLGFNEPDNATQSNVTVAAALAAWPQVASKAPTVGAPAMAGNPVTGTWLPVFMDAGPTVSFIPIHWYKGVDSAKFIADVTAVIGAYHLPVWVTEFAPQDNAQSLANPTQYTQAQVSQFVSDTVAWMEREPRVQRYAWHTSTVGTSCLYAADGGLSETGTAYANAH